jgi:hypothetical protein
LLDVDLSEVNKSQRIAYLSSLVLSFISDQSSSDFVGFCNVTNFTNGQKSNMKHQPASYMFQP